MYKMARSRLCFLCLVTLLLTVIKSVVGQDDYALSVDSTTEDIPIYDFTKPEPTGQTEDSSIVSVVDVGSTNVIIEWSNPVDVNDIKAYQVLYYPDGHPKQENVFLVRPPITKATLEGLTPDTGYLIEVTAQTEHSTIKYVGIVYVRTSKEVSLSGTSNAIGLIVGVVIGLVVLVGFIAVVLWFYCPKSANQTPTTKDGKNDTHRVDVKNNCFELQEGEYQELNLDANLNAVAESYQDMQPQSNTAGAQPNSYYQNQISSTRPESHEYQNMQPHTNGALPENTHYEVVLHTMKSTS